MECIAEINTKGRFRVKIHCEMPDGTKKLVLIQQVGDTLLLSNDSGTMLPIIPESRNSLSIQVADMEVFGDGN